MRWSPRVSTRWATACAACSAAQLRFRPRPVPQSLASPAASSIAWPVARLSRPPKIAAPPSAGCFLCCVAACARFGTPRLPRSMKFLDEPALRIAAEHLQRIVLAVDRMRRQKQPAHRLDARRRLVLVRQHRPQRRFVVPLFLMVDKVQLDGSRPHRQQRLPRRTAGLSWNVQKMRSHRSLLLDVAPQIALRLPRSPP